MLVSAIDDEYKNKFTIDKYMLDSIKMYINPEYYKAEKDHEKGRTHSMVRENREFAQHYRSAMNGKVEVSNTMKTAIKWLEDTRESERIHTITDMQQVSDEVADDDDDTLGT